MTGFDSKRQAAQDKMELADAYASAVAATPNMPTPLERKLAVERIERARNALESALEQQQDKLTDEVDTLTIVYQQGFADGKAAQQQAEPVAQSDLIKRLRDTASKGVSVWGDLQMEAAREIEILTAQRKSLTVTTILNMMPSTIPAEYDGELMEFARAVEAAHNIKEQP